MRKETKYVMRVQTQEKQEFYIALDEELEELIEHIIIAMAMAWGSDTKLSILPSNIRTGELMLIFDVLGYRENLS